MSANKLKVVESRKDKTYYDDKKQELFDLGYVKIHKDERYSNAFEYLEEHNLSVKIHKKISYKKHLIEHDDKRRKYCQPRKQGVDKVKVNDYAERFRAGENQNLPIVGIRYEDGKVNPFFGNQRALARKKEEESTDSAMSDFCEVTHPTHSPEEMHYHAARLAGMSNARTNHEVDVSTSEDIVTNVRAIWESYCKIDPATKYWTEEQKIKWAKEEIVRINPTYVGKSYAPIVGRYAHQCFSSDHGFRNDTVISPARLRQIFKEFFPNNQWDVSSEGFTKSGVWQQSLELSTAPKQNLMLQVFGNIDYPHPSDPETWTHDKSRTPVHLMFKVGKGILCISSREKKVKTHLQHITCWNKAEKNIQAGSFLVEKIVFLAGYDECEDEAYSWNAQMQRLDKVVIK